MAIGLGDAGRGVHVAAAVCLLLLTLTGACAPRAREAAPAPEEAVRSYLAALERGDADAAFELLAPALRGEHDRPSFRAYYEENREELIAQARAAVDAVGRHPPDLRAVVVVDGVPVEVVREADGRWRLAQPLWPRDPTGTPADTLRALADGLAHGDLARIRDTLLDEPARERLSCIVESLREAAARAAESDPGPPAADPLLVPLSGGGHVTLGRVGEEWRIRSLALPCAPPEEPSP